MCTVPDRNLRNPEYMGEIGLSVIVPLYNEEECVIPLYEAIKSGVLPLGMEFEILFVDDGSRDRTFSVARTIAENDNRLRLIKFRRNYGQTPAMAAGIDHARGKILITMDGDLQNDPEDIPRFIEKIEEGFDIVCGWREKRQDKLVTRKIPSKIANWMIGKVTGVPIRDNGCSLKAYRKEVIQKIPLYSEMHRFIPAMASIAGSRIAQIPVRHHARKYGKSKYGLSRIYKVLLDLLLIKTLVSFSSRPMLWFGGMSFLSAFGSLTTFAFAIARWNRSEGESLVVLNGTALLLGALAIFLLFAGALGELAYKTGNLKMTTLADIRASFSGFEKPQREE
jgi:glycosyltransferase involved in cell wall biosynthesis